MTCPNGHTEEHIEERDGRRVCQACRQRYLAETNKRRQSAIKRNRDGRHNSQNGRLRKQAAKRNKAAQNRIQLRADARDTSPTRVTSQEKHHDEHRNA